jgi:hypothetical protein
MQQSGWQNRLFLVPWRALLISMGGFEDGLLAQWPAQKLQTDRQARPAAESAWHTDAAQPRQIA